MVWQVERDGQAERICRARRGCSGTRWRSAHLFEHARERSTFVPLSFLSFFPTSFSGCGRRSSADSFHSPLPPSHLISPFHKNAELNQLSGIAAILNFPLDVEVAEEEDRLELERAKELEKDRRHEQGLS